MFTKIFFEDLSPDMQSRIRWALRYELQEEIDEAAQNGRDRDKIEDELLADYINRHNIGCAFEI